MLTGYYPQHQQQPQHQQEQMSINGQNGSSKDVPSSLTRHLTSSVYKAPTTTSILISTSSSRMFTSNSYEISDEISRANVQVLERKYGGRFRAHAAAIRIQRAFRRFRLEQQFQNALKFPGSHKIIQPMIPNDSSLNTFHLNGDRQLYTRKLALSQPTLRYQPTVSLRAQLRTQEGTFEDSYLNHLASPTSTSGSQNQSPVHRRSPPSPRPSEPMPSKNGWIEDYYGDNNSRSPRTRNPLHMSPRLIQRRPPVSDFVGVGDSSSLNRLPVMASQKYISPPPATQSRKVVVAAGTSPIVWVPRRNNEINSTPKQQHQSMEESREKVVHEKRSLVEPRKEVTRPRTSENGHVAAYFTNSLSRLDRRNHSVGPHTTTNSSGFQTNFALSPNFRIMPPREEQYRKRCYRIALNYFNKKPERGLFLLLQFGFVEDNPQAIAEFLIVRRGLSRSMIGEFLGTLHSPPHAAVLEAYLDRISMFNMELDIALRHMLSYFRFPGEAQKIDYIVRAFARRYLVCNPERYQCGFETIYVISFAIILLNTDLHTPSIKNSKRMKLNDFIKNVRNCDNTEAFTDKILTDIYERVKQHEFKASTDHVTQVSKVDESLFGKGKPQLVEPHRRLICYCRLNQVQDVNRKQSATAHNRELFLFNDLLIIAKTKEKKVAQYNLRYWTPLLGVKISTFSSHFYRYGLQICCPDGEEFVFNAKNDDDRTRFFNDVRETVLEATEMESLRIELELDKQTNSSVIGKRLAFNTKWSSKKYDDYVENEVENNSPIANIGTPPFQSESVAPTPSVSVGKLSHNGVSTSSGCSASNASTASASSNSTPAPPNRRLSFNSLDSGMVEEAVDLSV